MKKLFATLTILFVTTIVFAGGVFASELYHNWNGTSAYQNILVTLQQITTRGQELKTERDNSNRTNEQLVNQVKDKDNLINAKTQENDALKKENDNLKESSTNKSNELKQAEIDMSDVDQKSKDVLNKLR